MATRCFIGMRNPDGTTTSIYCHHDGYPEHVGNILVHHYTNPDKIRELLALGAISILGPRIGEAHAWSDNDAWHKRGWCHAYIRDRGDHGFPGRTHPGGKHPNADLDPTYEFVDGEWLYWCDKVCVPVRQLLKDSEPKWPELLPKTELPVSIVLPTMPERVARAVAEDDVPELQSVQKTLGERRVAHVTEDEFLLYRYVCKMLEAYRYRDLGKTWDQRKKLVQAEDIADHMHHDYFDRPERNL